MLSVYIADTGETVVLHDATQTVVVADDFDAALVRLKTELGDDAERLLRTPPPAPTKTRGSLGHYGVLALLALLPFVWLGGLHASLGGLVVSLRDEMRRPEQPDLSKQVETLEAETSAIGNQVHKLTAAVDRLKKSNPRKAPKPPPVKAPVAAPAKAPVAAPAKTPADAPAKTPAELPAAPAKAVPAAK